MAKDKRIRDRFNKAKEHAVLLKKTIKNDFDEICNFALASDVSNMALEFEDIIDELLKRK